MFSSPVRISKAHPDDKILFSVDKYSLILSVCLLILVSFPIYVFLLLWGTISLLNIQLLLYLPSSAQKLVNLGDVMSCYDFLSLYLTISSVLFQPMLTMVLRSTTCFPVLALSSFLTKLKQKRNKLLI